MYDYSEDDIKEVLVKIGISSGDTVYCHSNIGLFGRIKKFTDKEGVCSKFYSSIFDIIGKKGTLLVPTFTTHIPTNNKVFDKNNTPSKMGLFAEWVRKHPKSIRSNDPFYSFAANGANANYFCKNIPSNSFAKNSVFDKLYLRNAKLLCLNHPGCTFLHYVERELNVPYRFDKTFSSTIIRNGHLVKQNWKIWVRYLSDDKLGHEPKKFVEFIKNESIGSFASLGRGEMLSLTTTQIYNSVITGLKQDKWFLVRAKKNDTQVIINENHK